MDEYMDGNKEVSFTDSCLKAIMNSKEYAERKNFEFVTVDNLMLFISKTSKGKEIFEAVGLNPMSFQHETETYLDEEIPKRADGELNFDISIQFANLIKSAILLANSDGNIGAVNEGHIMVALFDSEYEDTFISNYFAHYKISKFDIVSYLTEGKKKDPSKQSEDNKDKSNSVLDKFAVLLNNKAKEGKIDPIIGREEEINKVITILAQRRKNNPVLVGEAGVGKTAIAEGLAKKIVEKTVPIQLQDFLIYSLDLTAVVAGTRYRGDFEERLKNIVKEASQNPNIVLFIDEIHTLIGTGAGNSSMDASNMLKPALSSGELKVIGSTTYDEYRKIFEKEGALSRRFQKVDIIEPSEEDSIKILMGLKPQYESFHNIKYSEEAIETAVKLTSKYINDRKLPDKAIDIIDMVGAQNKLTNEVDIITEKEIAKLISKVVRIPVDDVEATEKNKLKNLENDLKKEIYGQDNAITQVADTIIYSRGIGALKPKPIGSFLLAGPSGVGKTELAKQLSNKLGIPFLRFDMSEYMEKHTVSRLVGAPPGYVGYEQGGQLTDAIKKSPHCVLLFDEIEKAHPDIYNILLQVMDYGVLTDTNGVKADFKNVIFMMTSNIGAAEINKSTLGFTSSTSTLDQEVKNRENLIKKEFPPEFYNRLDAVIQFNPLNEENIAKVVEKHLNQLSIQLKDKDVQAIYSEDLIKFVAKAGFDPKLGARPIERFIEKEIARPLSKEIVLGSLDFGGKVKLNVKDEKIVFEDIISFRKEKENMLADSINKSLDESNNEKKLGKRRKKINS